MRRRLAPWLIVGLSVVARVGAAQPSDLWPPTPPDAPAAPPPPESPPPEPAEAPAPPAAPEPPPPAVPADELPPAADTEEPAASSVPLALSTLQIHGFVSQGAFVSTDNEYIGRSSRGSLALFEAGLNVSTEVADRLRAGIQLFGRNVGNYKDLPPRLDWAFLDYRWKSWLGIRAGVIRLPLGLYNEFSDVDAARVPVLLPQSIYQLRNRSAFLSHTGFALYGNKDIGRAGSLDYQVLLGTLDIPENALVLGGATLDEIDAKYMTGGQLLWNTPLEGLRVGATYLRTSIDFHLTLDAANTAALIMAGLVPPTFDGTVVLSQRPDTVVVGSAEYVRGDWLFAAEYGRSLKRQRSTLPAVVLPPLDEDNERFYAMVNRRFSRAFEAGLYYSVVHIDADDRRGRDKAVFPERWYAWQRDLGVTLRLDVNERWFWKLEAHFIDGVADLFGSTPDPERYWGLFLLKTTVTF